MEQAKNKTRPWPVNTTKGTRLQRIGPLQVDTIQGLLKKKKKYRAKDWTVTDLSDIEKVHFEMEWFLNPANSWL